VFQPNGSLQIVSLTSVDTFSRAMDNIRATAAKHNVIPLYHYTAPFVGSLILKGGLRMSSQGQGDGGVYFSLKGPLSYNLGSKNYEKNLIKDCFGVERVDEYLGKGKLDAVIVYGCEADVLVQAPGGRDNAKMVPKPYFSSLSLPQFDGDYFLRPDRILGCFVFNSNVKKRQHHQQHQNPQQQQQHENAIQSFTNNDNNDDDLLLYNNEMNNEKKIRDVLLENYLNTTKFSIELYDISKNQYQDDDDDDDDGDENEGNVSKENDVEVGGGGGLLKLGDVYSSSQKFEKEETSSPRPGNKKFSSLTSGNHSAFILSDNPLFKTSKPTHKIGNSTDMATVASLSYQDESSKSSTFNNNNNFEVEMVDSSTRI